MLSTRLLVTNLNSYHRLFCRKCVRTLNKTVVQNVHQIVIAMVFAQRLFTYTQSCPATTRLVITLIACNAVGRASRFFRPLGFFFFLSCIYFWTANCFIFYSRVVLQCMYFATMYFYHYVYCIFIRICFIALCRKIAH